MHTILITASSRKSPTPKPTLIIRTVGFILPLICVARTDKSGSATVINTPIKKHTPRRSPIFLSFDSPAPIWSPIGIIARSAPSEKSPIPITSAIAETINVISSESERFIRGVKWSITTISATGRTEINASLILLSKAENTLNSPYFT